MHPADRESFGAEALMPLRQAVSDLSWLLSRGYARTSALKLVGDRHALTERQRLAVGRAACANASREGRAPRRMTPEEMRGLDAVVDGFNLLVTLEAALSGGVLLFCRDGCIRDMSSVHGSYHSVMETEGALHAVGVRLVELGVRSVHWLLDRPVSNSGRLAQRLRELAREKGWHWTVDVVFNPDAALIAAHGVAVISSDSLVIDQAEAWFNLAADLILDREIPNLWLVDLRD